MKYIAVVAFALTLAACAAGTDFKKLDSNQLTYGESTSVDVVQKQGSPGKTGTETKDGITYDLIAYVFADAGGTPDKEGVTPARAQAFYFKDDVLVGSEFSSSFASDSTKFDESKISMIKENSTTLDELIALMGQPSGEYIHPLVAKEGERAKVYVHSQTTVSGLEIIARRKELIVSYDPKTGVVTQIEYNEIGAE
ncbi:hypothetical protein GQF03_07650 [Sneathiella chungangensis]|uniref:Lipoprotein n=1 Tax=Sneathiella chungangensis TaxID=1418234 RepID=A0A845MEA9_9PROT|nr:hypothetical protein [Sneathiella chungangensis]MZR22199.1 hypothetical protein [Sneathiella chungangensis]